MKRPPRRTTFATVILAALLACAWAAPGAASARGGQKVTRLAVTFQVSNVNGSALSCPSDGAPYAVKGHIVGPASKISDPSDEAGAVTLYLHSVSFGAFFWSFSAVPRYDYAAALARAGHTSVVIDRLGYGASGHPDGNQTCLGADADVAHQVVGKLHSGDYVVDGGRPVRFDRVALAGHSVGALIANLEAYSFQDVDGLIAMAYTPQVTLQAFEHFYATRAACEAGGEPANPGGPGGYAFFGQPGAEFGANVFHSAEPAVEAVTARLRQRDPCGETASIVDALVRDLKSRSQVKVPVLLVCGREDAITPDFACPYLKRHYTGSKDVSLAFVRNSGHALPLERTAPAFRRRVSRWLTAHGF